MSGSSPTGTCGTSRDHTPRCAKSTSPGLTRATVCATCLSVGDRGAFAPSARKATGTVGTCRKPHALAAATSAGETRSPGARKAAIAFTPVICASRSAVTSMFSQYLAALQVKVRPAKAPNCGRTRNPGGLPRTSPSQSTSSRVCDAKACPSSPRAFHQGAQVLSSASPPWGVGSADAKNVARTLCRCSTTATNGATSIEPVRKLRYTGLSQAGVGATGADAVCAMAAPISDKATAAPSRRNNAVWDVGKVRCALAGLLVGKSSQAWGAPATTPSAARRA